MLHLDHVALRVSDLDASIRFYSERLNLTLMFKEVDREHHEAFAFLELNGGNLELLQLLDGDNRPLPYSSTVPEPPYCPHIAIGVSDVNEMIDNLTKSGTKLLKGPLEIPGKVRWCYFSDPDNNVIEFVEWL
jgi:catechol 2,3-dioxygenase-like lactoylglutathione lyase family enzyme